MKYKTFKNQAAQGDCFITRVDELPDGLTEAKPDKEGNLIVAHSETGHHHFINKAEARFYNSEDPMVCYLTVDNSATMIHNRSFDTHIPLRIPKGTYQMRRQREHTPEGWRQVQD